MMTKSKHIVSAAFLVGVLVSIWFFVANAQQPQPASYVFVVCMVIGIWLAVRTFNNDLVLVAKKHITNAINARHGIGMSLLILGVAGICARLFIYFHFSYDPVSDPMTFYQTAQGINTGHGLQGDAYVAMFPYLAAYDILLSTAMRFIENPWLATTILNTIFDILSSLLLFITIKRIVKVNSGTLLPIAAFGLWILNPLNIIFSVISIPVVVVNFFIILSLLLSYILIDGVAKLSFRSAITTSVLLGVVIGLSNCFRPIFAVPIIALAIVFVTMAVATKKSFQFLRLSITSILLVFSLMVGIQKIYFAFVSDQTNLDIAVNPSGVSLYVGSDWETSGQWRPYLNAEMGAICQESMAKNDFDACHTSLRNAAIERYKEYGVHNSVFLFISKLYHQAGDQSYFYNANQSIVGYAISKTAKVVNIYTILYITTLFALSAKFLYSIAKRPYKDAATNGILLAIVLTMIGWFSSFVLMESAPRYSTIIYPLFTIFSVLAFDDRSNITKKWTRKPVVSARKWYNW